MSLLPHWAPNLHPLLVHFPIAWWIAAVVVDLVALMFPRAAWAATTAAVLYPAGAAAAVVTYLTGRQAAATVLTPALAHPAVLSHWNWALVTTVVFGLIAAGRLWARLAATRSPRWMRAVLVVAALAALGSLIQTGELGARLVYQHGVGVFAPAR